MAFVAGSGNCVAPGSSCSIDVLCTWAACAPTSAQSISFCLLHFYALHWPWCLPLPFHLHFIFYARLDLAGANPFTSYLIPLRVLCTIAAVFVVAVHLPFILALILFASGGIMRSAVGEEGEEREASWAPSLLVYLLLASWSTRIRVRPQRPVCPNSHCARSLRSWSPRRSTRMQRCGMRACALVSSTRLVFAHSDLAIFLPFFRFRLWCFASAARPLLSVLAHPLKILDKNAAYSRYRHVLPHRTAWYIRGSVHIIGPVRRAGENARHAYHHDCPARCDYEVRELERGYRDPRVGPYPHPEYEL
ncbi:hypothetical protein B0H13DRAFT_2377095 [Mycena leptocephala]|nr:hypothetical protein B0H13DRAFT_2377095 [Mycena leptocephala]